MRIPRTIGLTVAAALALGVLPPVGPAHAADATAASGPRSNAYRSPRKDPGRNDYHANYHADYNSNRGDEDGDRSGRRDGVDDRDARWSPRGLDGTERTPYGWRR